MELLTVVHRDFTMSIECSKFDATWGKAVGNVGEANLTSTYSWSEGVERVIRTDDDGNKREINIGEAAPAVFFENTDYPVWVEFQSGVKRARFGSMLQSDNERFSFRRGILAGFINYGNEIGKSEIVFDYEMEDEVRHFRLEFEVLSTKLNYHEHWRTIVEEIEQEYRMLSLDFMRRTFHGFSSEAEGETPDLVWWSIFEREQQTFVKAVKSVIERPRRRLQGMETYRRADKLTRIPIAVENELAEHYTEKAHLYRVVEQVRSNDTQENRFLKYALGQIATKYESLKRRIESVKGTSDPFREKMEDMLTCLKHLQRNPFFRTVGKFKGLTQESLILQKATGYSQVYKTWNMLRRAYSLNDGIYRLQSKDIATLYEIWCFIEISHIVRDLLGADVETEHRNRMEMNGVFTWELGKGEHSRILFRKDSVELAELVYNPKHTSTENGKVGIGHVVVPTVAQKPDIVLQLTKDDLQKGMKMTYLFDAKYRIEGRTPTGVDTPPDDAINQMHRYRDAIYYKDQSGAAAELKKEVIGGYILFPGDGAPAEVAKARFQQSLDEVNIGAFPLRPKDEENRKLLETFIGELIGHSASELLDGSIPQKGLCYNEGDALYFVISFTKNENSEDWEKMKNRENCCLRCGFRGPREDVNIQSIRYVAPLVGHLFSGYYKVKSIRTKTIEDEHYPVRVAFELTDFHPLTAPVTYGIKDAPRGRAFTQSEFLDFCQHHQSH